MAGAEAEALALTAQRIEAETEERGRRWEPEVPVKAPGAALRGATRRDEGS